MHRQYALVSIDNLPQPRDENLVVHQVFDADPDLNFSQRMEALRVPCWQIAKEALLEDHTLVDLSAQDHPPVEEPGEGADFITFRPDGSVFCWWFIEAVALSWKSKG